MSGNVLQEYLEGKIDFAGQKLVDDIVRIWLIAATAISFVAGFALQSLLVTFSILGLSTVALLVVVIPPWPMFNRHPVKWLPVAETKKSK
ncbi:microsomal signal peptidase [Dendrothele bispora CBS 962.96]|uniref:Signal peptidase complex subunit 1 n=1 Tax=Dendrothele bispora (strain CBS 962.96) TaxID=1314807 RepID=A0A4S8LMQ3_DENBC|nr:microsomal signal peptidase [Dendrothele bispora CBS 962.96]